MRSARRSNKVHGFVNFPIRTMESSREGGMFVRLWAVPKDGSAGLCCGTEAYEAVDSQFIGADTTKKQQAQNDQWVHDAYEKGITTMAQANRLYKTEKKMELAITSQFWRAEESGRRWSSPLACSILMGSTGWSSSGFICEFKDLTDAGRALYDSVKALHKGCTLHLLTFLDT